LVLARLSVYKDLEDTVEILRNEVKILRKKYGDVILEVGDKD
jgi:hypothetical protein